MKKCINVRAGDVMVGQGEIILKSEARRACLVVAAHDRIKKIGGLAHAVFLKSELNGECNTSAIGTASSAIDEMIDDMMHLGSSPEDIEVCMVTGENIPHVEHDPNYDKNLASVVALLQKKHIRYKDGSILDVGGQHISLDVASGGISVCQDERTSPIMRCAAA